MFIGYARVSTDDQYLDLQLDALMKAGCERVFEDTESGAKSGRTGLTSLHATLRPGGTVVIWRLDRLGRSLKDLIYLVESILSRQLDDLEPTPTRHGYRVKDLVEQFDAKPAEIPALFANSPDPARAATLRDKMLAAGLPIRVLSVADNPSTRARSLAVIQSRKSR
ncbi:recombinase family protein [Burkholderia stagnalis]